MLIFPILPVRAVGSYTDDQVMNKLINQEDFMVIDGRSESAYIDGHIPSAIFIDFSTEDYSGIKSLLETQLKSEYIIYCSCVGGANARHDAEGLESVGMENVFYMSDDFRDWPYNITIGEYPGSVAVISSNSNSPSNTTTNPNNVEMSNLFLLNIALVIIVVSVIIIKKKR